MRPASRRLLITGLIQAALVVVIAAAVLWIVRDYYIRLVFVVAGAVDFVMSLRSITSALRDAPENS